jgi:hypothetical protein
MSFIRSASSVSRNFIIWTGLCFVVVWRFELCADSRLPTTEATLNVVFASLDSKNARERHFKKIPPVFSTHP